jgi:soluble lytic murein transglycosylase-like protein
MTGIERVTDRILRIEGRIGRLAQSFEPPVPGRFGEMLAQRLRPGKSPRGSAANPTEWEPLITREALNNRLDPALLRAVMIAESGGDPTAVSSAGAQGLMQLMPSTAAGLGVTDPFDPAQNVGGGARFLRAMLDRYGGDVRRGVAAYNAGPGAVDRYGGIPPYDETQAYVRRVLDLAGLDHLR